MTSSGVCMIITHFYPQIGGAEKQVEHLARKLVQWGIPVIVLTRHFDNLPVYERLDGAEIYRVRVLPGKVPGTLSFLLAGLIFMLRHRHRYHIIHCHQIYSPTTLGWLASSMLRRPLLAHLHLGGPKGDVLNLLRHYPGGRIRLEILKRSVTKFLVVSKEIEQELLAEGCSASMIEYLANAVDTQCFVPVDAETKIALRQELGLPVDGPLVIYLGRLTETKGVHILLEAWEHMPPPARLVIVGAGPAEKALRAQAAQFGERVIFAGVQHKTAPYLQASDCWTLPSFAEGLSLSLLEAMACGLPVVTTAVGETPLIVTHNENGLLVPAGDVEALADTLRNVLDHPEAARLMGEHAHQTVVERYSLDRVGQAYLDILNQITP